MSRATRSTRILGVGVATAALVGAGALPARAALPTPTPATGLGHLSDYVKLAQQRGGHVLSGRYFVQVAGAPTIDGGTAASASSTQGKVEKAAGGRGVHLQVTHSYTHLWNGFAAQVSDADAQKLETVPGVTAVFPVVDVQAPIDVKTNPKTPAQAHTEDTSSAAMGGVQVAQDELGYTGKGIKVGVIDTGVDLDNPDFGGTGVNGTTPFPNKKVVAGYDFVGDGYDAKTGSPAVPDPNPDDNCAGHGSHVSGIIAADGNPSSGGVRGAAPDAQLGEYRVFGCTGSTGTDIILQAMERAYTDGMNVVNMSLGDSFMAWPGYPDAVAADKLVSEGITVVTSAGNDGASGAMSTGAPSSGHDVISVASMENNIITAPAFKVTPDGSLIGYGNSEGAPILGSSGSHQLMTLGADATPASYACDPIPAVPAGTYVLVSRGGCTFATKALNAQKAGAAGVVLYNNQPGTISATVAGDTPITIPVVGISQDDGRKLQALTASGPITLTATSSTVQKPNPNGGRISDFSSWGLDDDLALKPDITAPGGNIWSSYPLALGGHASLSGTSMAAPYVTGSVALLMQAKPALLHRPHAILQLLQNTANMNNVWSMKPDLKLPELVTRQGAGLIQVDKAIEARQSLKPGKISLGEGEHGAKTVTVTVSNQGKRDVVYDITSINSIGYLGNSNPAFDTLAPQVLMRNRVRVPAHGTRTFPVTIAQPKDAPNGYVYGGWIQLTAPGATTLTLPFAGMAGDYQQVPIFDDTIDHNTYPALGAWDATTGAAAPVTGTVPTFSMKGTDVPYVLFHLEYPVSDLQVQVYKVNGSTRTYAGTFFKLGEYGRDNSHMSLPWDGTVTVGKGQAAHAVTLPAGNYSLELRGLEPLGKAQNKKNWVVYDTPAFTIADPAAAAKAAAGSAPLQVASGR